LRAAVTSVDGERALRVSLGRRGLLATRVPTGRYVRTQFVVPPGKGPAILVFASNRVPGTPGTGYGKPHHLLPLRFLRMKIEGLPLSSSPARRIFERIYQRTLDPNAVAGFQPGVVDNQYLSWLFQYGFVFGITLCLLWLGILLVPFVVRVPAAVGLSALMFGAFLAVTSVAVNVWEESPIDLLAALTWAHAWRLSSS
jgi:hypothetical protein